MLNSIPCPISTGTAPSTASDSIGVAWMYRHERPSGALEPISGAPLFLATHEHARMPLPAHNAIMARRVTGREPPASASGRKGRPR